MSEALYKFGGLRFWNEEEIDARERSAQLKSLFPRPQNRNLASVSLSGQVGSQSGRYRDSPCYY